MDWWQILVAIIIFVVFTGIFIITYVFNKRVPKPEGCEEIDESCLNCSNSLCKQNPKRKKENDDLKEE